MLLGSKGRRLVMNMPRDRLLTESDGPFAQLDGECAWPGDVKMAVEILARLWFEPVEAVDGQLLTNLRRLAATLPEAAPTVPRSQLPLA